MKQLSDGTYIIDGVFKQYRVHQVREQLGVHYPLLCDGTDTKPCIVNIELGSNPTVRGLLIFQQPMVNKTLSFAVLEYVLTQLHYRNDLACYWWHCKKTTNLSVGTTEPFYNVFKQYKDHGILVMVDQLLDAGYEVV